MENNSRKRFSLEDVGSWLSNRRRMQADKPPIPENLSAFAKYLTNQTLAKFGLLEPGKPHGTITEQALSANTEATLAKAIENARQAGRNYVTYDDYPDMYNGMSIKDFVSSSDARREQYGTGLPSYIRIMLDSYDPSLAAATLVGGFNFTETENGYKITEPYDFGKITDRKSNDPDPYRSIREWVGTDPSKQVPMSVEMNIAKRNVGE